MTVATAAIPRMEERFVNLGGRRLRFLIGGTGKPLVLCHGFISSGEEFGGRFEALASQHTLIAPDLPGNGQSAPLPSRHTAEAMAGTVWQLLDHLDIHSFDLAGLCLGASVACAMAADNEAAVDHLILHTPLLGEGLIRAQYRWQVRILTVRPLWAQVAWLSRRRTVSDLYKRIAIEGKVVDPYTATTGGVLAEQARAAEVPVIPIPAGFEPRAAIAYIGQQSGLVGHLSALENVELVIDKLGGHGWSPDAVVRHLALMRLALD